MGNNLITDGGNVDVYFTKYKAYVAIVSQVGTGAPTPIILNAGDSNFLGNINWTYDQIGRYLGVLEGAFTANKTFFFIANNMSLSLYGIACNYYDTDNIMITMEDMADGSSVDGGLLNTPIEIRVYQ